MHPKSKITFPGNRLHILKKVFAPLLSSFLSGFRKAAAKVSRVMSAQIILDDFSILIILFVTGFWLFMFILYMELESLKQAIILAVAGSH